MASCGKDLVNCKPLAKMLSKSFKECKNIPLYKENFLGMDCLISVGMAAHISSMRSRLRVRLFCSQSFLSPVPKPIMATLSVSVDGLITKDCLLEDALKPMGKTAAANRPVPGVNASKRESPNAAPATITTCKMPLPSILSPSLFWLEAACTSPACATVPAMGVCAAPVSDTAPPVWPAAPASPSPNTSPQDSSPE